MKTDGIFTLHKKEMIYQRAGETFNLIPLGDIHRFAAGCHVERYLEFIGWAKEQPNAYFIGMGDYDDFTNAGDRKRLVEAGLTDDSEAAITDMCKSRVEKMAKELSPLKNRFIGLLGGNHFGRLMSGISTDQYLAELLGVPYLGVCSIIRLAFRKARTDPKTGNHHHPFTVDIFAHHGLGAARLIGGSLNRVYQMQEIVSADIYLMGHDHQKIPAPKSKLELSDGRGNNKLKLRHRKQLFVRTGSFLRSYIGEDPTDLKNRDHVPARSYNVDALRPPVELGVVRVDITIKTTHDGETFPDIHAWV